MKKIRFLFFVFAVFLSFSIQVHASDDGFFSIHDEASFDKCLELSTTCRLHNDLILNSQKVISKDVLLDLNGKTLSPDANLKLSSGFLVVERGARLTINDSLGTGKITTGSSGNVWGAIQLVKEDVGSSIAELEVNGGTLEGYYYGIVGNGKRNHTKVTIRNGTITCTNTEDCTAIFQPQKGDLIIYNGTITGGTGIEIRSGNLTIYDGTIKGVDPNFSKMSNSNGTTTEGVGVAVAQHITKQDIDVAIHGGNISGQYAFYEWNSQKNEKEDLDKIKLTIDGGNFEGLANGVPAVFSEDFTAFISGGKFNTSVNDYLTSDAKVVSKLIEDVPEQKRSLGVIEYILIFSCLVFGGLLFFKLKSSIIF